MLRCRHAKRLERVILEASARVEKREMQCVTHFLAAGKGRIRYFFITLHTYFYNVDLSSERGTIQTKD